MKIRLTITLTRYAEPNWLFTQTLDSIAAQQDVQATVLVLDQQNDCDIRALCKRLSGKDIVFLYDPIPAKSLSYARNVAIQKCETDILLYLDTDAIASPDWAKCLGETLSQQSVALAGGKIIPLWHKRPSFLQKSQTVLDQYSMLDLGDNEKEVHRIVGANFGLNKATLGDLALFDENLGRRDGKLYSGEESALCKSALDAGLKVVYSGAAVVEHQVLPERIKFSWIATRMYYQGMSSAQRGGAPAPSNKGNYTVWDLLALMVLAPFYLYGYIKAK